MSWCVIGKPTQLLELAKTAKLFYFNNAIYLILAFIVENLEIR